MEHPAELLGKDFSYMMRVIEVSGSFTGHEPVFKATIVPVNLQYAEHDLTKFPRNYVVDIVDGVPFGSEPVYRPVIKSKQDGKRVQVLLRVGNDEFLQTISASDARELANRLNTISDCIEAGGS